jgi:Rad3-related DNA helicase
MARKKIADIYNDLIKSIPNSCYRESQLQMISAISSIIDSATSVEEGLTDKPGVTDNKIKFYNKKKVSPSQPNLVDQLAIPQSKSPICLIEAPTGTGKSLAYLLAGVVGALESNKKLVISTATKTLQSQLVSKDIPVFKKYSKLKFEYELAKGRSNYLCPYKLNNIINDPNGIGELDLLSVNGGLDNTKLGKIWELFESGEWGGGFRFIACCN